MKKTLKTSTALVAAGAVAGLLVACGDPPIEGDKDPTDKSTQDPLDAEETMKNQEEEMKKAQEAGAGDGGNEDDGGDTPPEDDGATPSP